MYILGRYRDSCPTTKAKRSPKNTKLTLRFLKILLTKGFEIHRRRQSPPLPTDLDTVIPKLEKIPLHHGFELG